MKGKLEISSRSLCTYLCRHSLVVSKPLSRAGHILHVMLRKRLQTHAVAALESPCLPGLGGTLKKTSRWMRRAKSSRRRPTNEDIVQLEVHAASRQRAVEGTAKRCRGCSSRGLGGGTAGG